MGDDRALIDDFLAGARDGRGSRLRIDGDVLAAEMPLPPDWALLVRLDADVHLLRDGAPDPGARSLRGQVTDRLRERGLRPVEVEEPAFLEVASTIIASLRTPDWTCWASDDEAGRSAIERVLVGQPVIELESPDATVGVTLDELLGDLADIDERLDEVARRFEERP